MDEQMQPPPGIFKSRMELNEKKEFLKEAEKVSKKCTFDQD